MSTRRRVLAALGATALGGCTAFPRDRAAPTTNYGNGPQVDVDLSYDDAAEKLRCMVAMGTTVTASNTSRLEVHGDGGSAVVWVAREGDAKQSFPVEPGDGLVIGWEAPDAYVAWTGPNGESKRVFGQLDYETTTGDA